MAAATGRCSVDHSRHGLVVDRERAFWDEHVPSLEDCLHELRQGPDPNTALMLDAVGPLDGRRVLDFGCGVGLTSVWAAQRGAHVTGIDISHASIARAREVAERAGLAIELVAAEMTPDTFSPESFDAVIGRYVLHHVDLSLVAPMIGGVLAPGGRAAFLETMGLNPLLRLARRWLTGRAGIARYGSEDERPLERADLEVLRSAIGPVSLSVAEMTFLRIFDRNVLRFRVPWVSGVLRRGDDALLRLGLGAWSYHQVVSLNAGGAAS